MQMVINLDEDRFRIFDRVSGDPGRTIRGSLFSGVRSRHFAIDATSRASLMGIHFKPGGAIPFLQEPGGELRDITLGLDILWGNSAGELREKLLEAGNIHTRFSLLENFLLSRAIKPLARHPAVAYALQQFELSSGAISVAEVQDRVGLSARRFIEVFRDQTGLTPKLFCRIRRFQTVLSLIGTAPGPDWPGLAFQCGYFDQAHLIRDFRIFSGLNPSAYLRADTKRTNHLPLP